MTFAGAVSTKRKLTPTGQAGGGPDVTLGPTPTGHGGRGEGGREGGGGGVIAIRFVVEYLCFEQQIS